MCMVAVFSLVGFKLEKEIGKQVRLLSAKKVAGCCVFGSRGEVGG